MSNGKQQLQIEHQWRMPPDEGDDEESIVEGSPNGITGVRVRCELYENKNPNNNYLSILSEEEMLRLQLKDSRC